MSIVMTLMVAGSLFAQERGELNARVILFGEAVQTSGILLANGVKDQAEFQVGPGLRIMGQTSYDSPWFWEVAVRFPSEAKMVTNRDIGPAPTVNVLDATGIKVRYSYWSLGAGYLFPLGSVADFGIHLEGRGETINPKGTYSTTQGGTGGIDAHTVYFRPWVRASLDLKIKTGSVRTLVGVDAALAAMKVNQKHVLPLSEVDTQTLRALAPSWSGSAYAGIQF